MVKTAQYPLETRDELVQHGIILEIIACVLAWDDAKTLDKTWCAVSLRSSHRALSSVLSGVIGMICCMIYHAHNLLLVNCFCMRKVVLCNWFLSVCWWLVTVKCDVYLRIFSALMRRGCWWQTGCGLWLIVAAKNPLRYLVQWESANWCMLLYAKFLHGICFHVGWTVQGDFHSVLPREVAMIQRCNTADLCSKSQSVWFWWGFCSVFPENQSNLVDSASSHTLVSKIKPCTSKYKYYIVKLRMAHYISYSLFDSPLLLG